MNKALLNALRQKQYVSGEELSKQLNVSRTAVWKHVNELRTKGYEITSVFGLGYSLMQVPDLLLPDEISSGLNTVVLGRDITYIQEVTSTQDKARDLAMKGAAEGTTVIAETQLSGRGRLGRQWLSPRGTGVYLSIVLRPNLKASDALQIPLVAGVAASQAIEKVTSLRPSIKWPNDILLGGKKVAGILAEMSAEIDRLHYIVIGIGINVNSLGSQLPEEIQMIATSLSEAKGQRISRIKVVQQFLEDLELLYEEFKIHGFQSIRALWKAYDCTVGSSVTVSMGEEETQGEILDIDDDGALILRKCDGTEERIIAGDVSLRLGAMNREKRLRN